MYIWSFFFVVLHKPTLLLPSTFKTRHNDGIIIKISVYYVETCLVFKNSFPFILYTVHRYQILCSCHQVTIYNDAKNNINSTHLYTYWILSSIPIFLKSIILLMQTTNFVSSLFKTSLDTENHLEDEKNHKIYIFLKDVHILMRHNKHQCHLQHNLLTRSKRHSC